MILIFQFKNWGGQKKGLKKMIDVKSEKVQIWGKVSGEGKEEEGVDETGRRRRRRKLWQFDAYQITRWALLRRNPILAIEGASISRLNSKW